MASAAIATQTSKTRILTRIERFAPGKTFMAKDFLDIASRGMVDMTLASMPRNGTIRRIRRGMVDMTLASIARNCTIRRIRRGLYDVPKRNEALGGVASPDIDE